MKEEKKFRLAEEADLPRILSLYSLAAADLCSRGIFQWDESYPDRATLERDVEKREMYLLRDGGMLAACVVLNGEEPEQHRGIPWKYGGAPGVIHRLCVSVSLQGEGYGREAVLLSEREFRSRRLDCARLDAFPQNPAAVRLYAGLGYEKSGEVAFGDEIFFCFEKPLCRNAGGIQRASSGGRIL